MGGVGGVTEEDERGAFNGVPPFFADDVDEVDPEGAVGEEARFAEEIGEEILAIGDGVGLGGFVQPGASPYVFGTFDDEGAGGAVEGVGMDLKEAVFVFFEEEGEGVEQAVGAEPDVFGLPEGEGGLENVGKLFADGGVDPVGGDDEVVVGGINGEGGDAGGVGADGGDGVEEGFGGGWLVCWWVGWLRGEDGLVFEGHLDAEFAATILQDLEQAAAGHAREVVAVGADDFAFVVDVYRRPGDEFFRDAFVGGEVGFAKGVDGAIREDDAPAVGRARGVAFHDVNVVSRVGFFEENGRVEAAGAAAEEEGFHKLISSGIKAP